VIELAQAIGFLVGPIAAIFIAPLCLVFIGMLTWPDRRWAELITGAAVTSAVLAAWIVYWNLWNPIFIYVDEDRTVPAALHYWSAASWLTTMLSTPALCVLLGYSVFRSRRSRGRLTSQVPRQEGP